MNLFEVFCCVYMALVPDFITYTLPILNLSSVV